MKGIEALNFIGWFDAPGQSDPTHDPYRDGNCRCISCEAEVSSPDGIRTVSMRAQERPKCSFFYRIHKTCDDGSEAAALKALSMLRELWLTEDSPQANACMRDKIDRMGRAPVKLGEHDARNTIQRKI